MCISETVNFLAYMYNTVERSLYGKKIVKYYAETMIVKVLENFKVDFSSRIIAYLQVKKQNFTTLLTAINISF